MSEDCSRDRSSVAGIIFRAGELEVNLPEAETDLDALISLSPRVLSRFQTLFQEVEPERRRFGWMLGQIFGVYHGLDHWVRVGIYGLAIARALRDQGRVRTAGLAPERALEDAVLWAAFFHDCGRIGEGEEPDHGRTADRAWRQYADRVRLSRELAAAVSQALLFHVDHQPVDPAANEVAICLCNADRLDRVRLGQAPRPAWMYDDGIWQKLAPLSEKLLAEFSLAKVKTIL